MPIAREDHPGAARQTWRAASCLAAVAVAALTLFHSGVGQPASGWVGVHLALGLAGYGATRLALAAEGPIATRLIDLWGRMAVWGLPALLVVVAGVLAVGLALPPADLRNQAWTALWTVLGNSGPELFRQGVDDPRARDDLLMHGWLLCVAAQLIAGWTIAVAVAGRLGLFRWVWIAASIGLVVSLALELILRREAMYPAAVHVAAVRAWPFLAGSLVALAARRWSRPRDLPQSRLLAGLGWFGGAALPFYLWSWPSLALPRLLLARPLTTAETFLALAAAAALALATHVWIEQPLRRHFKAKPVRALALAVCALGGLGVTSAAVITLDGLPYRASAEVLAEEAAGLDRPPLQAACHTEGAALPAAHPCTVPAEADADVILWGNSHADHLSPAVLAWARQRGLAVRQATRSGCLPLLRERAGVASDDCAAFNRSAVAEWGREAPQVVIVNAAPTLPRGGVSADTARQLDVLFGELAHTLRMLRAQVGPRTLIVLLGTTPEYAFAPASCHARRDFLGLTTGMCDRAVPANAELAGVVDERLTALAAAEAGVAVYRPWTALCDRGGCRTRGPNGPWYRDGRHLTAAGGRAQSQALARLLNERFPGGR